MNEKENKAVMNAKEEEAVELTLEEAEQLNGGGKVLPPIEIMSCPGDCNGTKARICFVMECPHDRKGWEGAEVFLSCNR